LPIKSQPMLKISSTLINARMETSDHRLSQCFKGVGAVWNSLAGGKDGLVKCLFVFNWSWMRMGFYVST